MSVLHVALIISGPQLNQLLEYVRRQGLSLLLAAERAYPEAIEG